MFSFGRRYQQDCYIFFLTFDVNATLFKVISQLCFLSSLNAIKIRSYLILKKLFKILKHVLKT